MPLMIFLAAVWGIPPTHPRLSPSGHGSPGSGPVFSSSATQPSVVSWMNSNPSSSHQQLPNVPTCPQPGLMLSPAAPPFPRKLVDKVKTGQFVEMKELLADNVSFLNQLEAVPGMSAVHMLGAARPRFREVSSLASWCYCFLGYVAMRTADPSTRDHMAYARLIIEEAQRHGGLAWLDYMIAPSGSRQPVHDPAMRWNTNSPSLQASTILGQKQAGQGSFCTLCREVDHSRAQCALVCLEPSAPSVSAASKVTTRSSTQRRYNICISWNRGVCVFPGQCSFRHVCATCQSSNHKARDCAKTPDTSAYKVCLNTPRSTCIRRLKFSAAIPNSQYQLTTPILIAIFHPHNLTLYMPTANL